MGGGVRQERGVGQNLVSGRMTWREEEGEVKDNSWFLVCDRWCQYGATRGEPFWNPRTIGYEHHLALIASQFYSCLLFSTF